MYLPDDGPDTRRFSVSYQALLNEHATFLQMGDEEIEAKILEAMHFAMFVCWFKEVPSSVVLGDTGLLHEMLHIRMGVFGSRTKNEVLRTVRALFEQVLKLSP